MKNKSEYALLIILAFLMIFGLIGWAVSPEDESGQPLLLLPGVKEVEEYRRKANSWTEDMKLLDGRLAVLLNGNTSSLYTQSKNAQDLFSDYVALVQDIENTEAPAALTGLKNMLSNSSNAYINACQSALIWVSNSSAENLVYTEQLVDTAQDLLRELESSTWMD
jgi:hypothetical protein